MNYIKKERKNRLMPALITLMLLLSMIILPQSVVALAPVVSDIPDQTINEGESFTTISLDDYVDDDETPDEYIVWTTSGEVELTVDIDANRVATITIPGPYWNGSETITFTATDNESLFDSNDATFTVNAPPVVSDIPDQTIDQGASFTTITLDNYVDDLDNAASEIIWTTSGEVELTVDIVTRVATINIPTTFWAGSETITFTATDPGGLSDSDGATFTVIGFTPGVYKWGDATTDLVYDTTYASEAININTSAWTGSDGKKCYLYYPLYTSSGSPLSADNFAWGGPYKVGDINFEVYVTSNEANTDTLNTGGYDISFNRSGMWIFDSDSDHGTGFEGYIWVNTSTDYDISSVADFEYGSSGDITITVQEEGNDVGCMIAIIAPDDSTAYHNWQGDGSVTLGIVGYNFTMAGDYTIMAYRDFDEDPLVYLYPDEDGNAYNSSYGSDYSEGFPAVVSGYTYADVGPWDPPEKNATEGKFTVITGKPDAVALPGNNTMYWSFEGEVNISILGYDGEKLTGDDADLTMKIYNSDDEDVTSYLNSDLSKIDKGFIHINADPSNTADTWGRTGATVWGENGTWYAYIYKDILGDETEEWNTTVEWTVTSSPGLQFQWIDDDGVISDDNNDGVIPEVPDFNQQPLGIQFQLINDEHVNYGDGGALAEAAAKKNITISGDALFVGSLDKLPGTTYSDGTWNVPLIPLMKLNGGEITISANWKGYGSITETLTIGGTKLNGSIVTISPSEFIIDENVTLTVTVKGPAGYPYPNALVSLYWINDGGELQGLIDSTNGGGTTNGEYTFLFNKTQQTKNQTLAGNPWVGGDILAPRNISAYVDLFNVGCGYALARMKPQSDLKVEISKGAVMAGEKTSFYVNISIVDSNSNLTEQPVVDSDNPLQVAIYNAKGDKMTLDASFGSIRDTDLDATNNSIKDYFLKPGVYTLYAYNNTHDSVGHNTTLVVKAVDVTCDKGEFIWNVDKNISAAFTVKYYDDPINGTLRLYNITDVGAYNKTWVNESDTGNDTITLKVTNGIVTMYNVTADYLPPDKSQMNITFMFKPETTNSEFAKTTDVVPVKIPDVSASPASLPCNKLAMLDITTTGRGVGLPNVWVSIEIPGLTGEMDTATDAAGKATFVFTPPTTGDIIIKIENRTSTTKVSVTSWALYLDAPSQANENEVFTVTIRNGTATGAGIVGASVKFNRETKTTDSSGQVTFTAPAVTSDREYTIVATKEGYAEDTATIIVLNKPKLIIVSPSEANTGSTFNVVIADNAGNSVIGATVTFNTKIYTTGAQGIATLTAPSEEGKYTIAATFTGFTDADEVTITITPGGIPGFELLTLIAAIGVAFILLRRRRN